MKFFFAQYRCLLFLLLFAPIAVAQQAMYAQETSSRYLARIQLNTAAELMEVLERSEQLFVANNYQLQSPPVSFILHGPEAKVFLASNYQNNKAIVDLAARLAAFNVVEIKVCETWMEGESLDAEQLLPFVGTVPYWEVEKRRLIEQEGYTYF
jgi:intracellular sulfur oxidation DsrE/DsrF family protein